MNKKSVISYFGTQAKLAAALTQANKNWHASQGLISRWPDEVPELWARRIHDITDGENSLYISNPRFSDGK